jgi:hypothetical protein
LLDAHQLAHAHPSGSSADIIAGQILPFAPEPSRLCAMTEGAHGCLVVRRARTSMLPARMRLSEADRRLAPSLAFGHERAPRCEPGVHNPSARSSSCGVDVDLMLVRQPERAVELGLPLPRCIGPSALSRSRSGRSRKEAKPKTSRNFRVVT